MFNEFAVFVERVSGRQSQHTKWLRDQDRAERIGENLHAQLSGTETGSDSDVCRIFVMTMTGDQVWEMEL